MSRQAAGPLSPLKPSHPDRLYFAYASIHLLPLCSEACSLACSLEPRMLTLKSHPRARVARAVGCVLRAVGCVLRAASRLAQAPRSKHSLGLAHSPRSVATHSPNTLCGRARPKPAANQVADQVPQVHIHLLPPRHVRPRHPMHAQLAPARAEPLPKRSSKHRCHAMLCCVMLSPLRPPPTPRAYSIGSLLAPHEPPLAIAERTDGLRTHILKHTHNIYT